jgi:hypothetical protein
VFTQRGAIKEERKFNNAGLNTIYLPACSNSKSWKKLEIVYSILDFASIS